MKATAKPKTFKSFSELIPVFNVDKTNTSDWQQFLTVKGHTEQTFRNLPDDLKMALKLSFSKK